MAKSKPTKMLAILGRCRRTGRWRLGSRSSVVAFLGLCHLDMRDSFVDGEQLKMTVTVFLGSATFIVPNGAEVRPSGMSLLSGSTVDVPEHDDATDLPTLEIEWNSIFGRLRIISEDLIDDDEAIAGTVVATPMPVAATQQQAPSPQAAAPPPAIGFEDLDEPKSAPATPPPAVGFEDLDEPTPAPATPAPAVGFEDLD